MKTAMQELIDELESIKDYKYKELTIRLVKEKLEEEKGDLVKLLRWVLKHYSTATDIEGFFMWENPMGQPFDSMQVVDHYLKEKI